MNPVGNIAQQAVALSSPPTNTNAGADTPLTFKSQVNHLLVQNNTAAAAFVEVEAVASTASIQIAAGGLFQKDIECLSLHLFTAAAQPINAASGIVVRGWL